MEADTGLEGGAGSYKQKRAWERPGVAAGAAGAQAHTGHLTGMAGSGGTGDWEPGLGSGQGQGR